MRRRIDWVAQKLHARELLHIRAHAAALESTCDALNERVDNLSRSLAWAEDRAESWHDDFMRLVDDEGLQVGLTVSGQVVALPPAGSAT